MTEKLSAEEIIKCKWFDENYEEIKEKISAAAKQVGKEPNEIIFLAATKTVPVNVVNYAIEKGIRYIGENRVQELLSKKHELLPSAHRHFIGHLQTNKVKDIIGEVEMIESVHSLKLAKEINRQCEIKGTTIDILVEVNIGNEESKSGFMASEVETAISEIAKMPHIKVKGLMSIPPICENSQESTQYFKKLSKLFIDIRAKNMDNVSMVYLSMGMSGDYEEAILNGANIVRIGTALFGQRNYNK